jgi:Cu(I)/Ag(I) efflux system membrane fusion protein
MNPFKYGALFLFILTMTACGDAEQESVASPNGEAERVSVITDSTSQTVQQVLQSYYTLKDALVASDSVKAVLQSKELTQKIDSINLSSVQQKDEVLYASVKELPVTIKQAAIALGETKGLEAQRAIFETISDNLYELIKTIKPTGIATYHQYCPMAFEDKGAYWLSDTSHIQNPYFGKKMLICGEVTDSLHY